MNHKTVGLIAGPVFFFIILALPPFDSLVETAQRFLQSTPGADVGELVHSMKVVLGLTGLMVIWWLTEAIPLSATALLPAALLPWFHVVGVHDSTVNALTLRMVLANYANPVIYLFFGGFLLAAAMQKWKLDLRLTLWILTRGNLANDAKKILLGIMGVTAFLSMWISNTATAAIMLPLGLGILTLAGGKPGESRFGTALMLGIAWSASVGGIGTIIGTPPNAIALGILNNTLAAGTHVHISFLDWMLFGVPYVVLFLPIIWVLLLRLYPPETAGIEGGKQRLLGEKQKLSRLSAGEKGTIAVFLFAVACWLSNPFWDVFLPPHLAHLVSFVDEYAIGLFAGVVLFVIPVSLSKGEFLLSWGEAKNIDWGVLILFGGGIALSDAMFKTGVASWIAASTVGILGSPSTIVMMFAIILLVDLLTEVTSNTAVTSMMVPIVIAIALRTGENPSTLAVAAALAASMAFMLPVATPPNAIVFGSGYVRLREMMRAGLILDIIGWLFTIGIVWLFAYKLFGVLSF